jgi:phosphatidylserine decarboxylase
MKLSTQNSLVGKIADYFGLNNNFHEYTKVITEPGDTALISPVEAKVVNTGSIDRNAMLISKNNKQIQLEKLIGKYADQFLDGKYINFYLSPSNKHFWVTPYDGMFIYTQKNEGKSWLPVFTGLENILGIEMFSKAVKKNASIGSIFQTNDFPVAMIAVGSLNVNRIYTDYEEMRSYKKGTPCGYFCIGSSMLLCFPAHLKVLIDKGSDVKIGQRILI